MTKRHLKLWKIATASTFGLAAILGFGRATPAAAEGLLFWSTQGTPVQEQQAMREQVLAGFEGEVEFSPQEKGPFMTRIAAEQQAGTGTIAVIGGLHGDFASFPDAMTDLTALAGTLADIEINETYLDLGKLDSGEQKYLPWMQATYIMAANKQALEYLPEGADINSLSYDQLIAWGQNLADETGSPKFGLPVGPRGLIHRFVQGYLYPSFTNSMVTKFRSPEAVAMWEKMKELWAVTNPASTGYGFMQEPLLSGDVWVAWDHTARLADVLNQRPDDFVTFPAPAGPTGRGFMPVVAGLGIPTTSPDVEGAEKLIAYMMQPSSQVATLAALGFFPVVAAELPADMPAAARMSGEAIAMQSGSADANPGLLPVGLGEEGGKFNKAFTDAFQRIVLAGQDIATVLDEEAENVRAVMTSTQAPCWAPDAPSTGPCPVE